MADDSFNKSPQTVSLADEEAVREIVVETIFNLWDAVNNLTRLRPSRRVHYRVTIFGSARAQPGTFAYDERDRSVGIRVDLPFESLNELFAVHVLRVAQRLQERIPITIWIILITLISLGMMAVGYQTGIAGSRRSWARPILAVAFALVMALIADLDLPGGGFVRGSATTAG